MPRISFTRRQTLLGTAALGASLAMPSLSRAQSRPLVTHGVMSGDVAHDGAMIWSRADREAKMLVEWATSESMANAQAVPALAVGTPTDFTGKMALTGLPSDQDIFYRVTMTDLTDATSSEPVLGKFRTAPMGNRDVSFVWSGDTAGQGWGIDEDRGGMTTYATMLGHNPDFFLHSGDTVYADGPLKKEVELADGTVWKNVVTPAKRKVAETLDEFRGQHLYNYMDRNVQHQKQPAEIQDIAWKAQSRLTARYRKLSQRGKKSTVVTTAIAREMAAFMWDIARRTMPAC